MLTTSAHLSMPSLTASKNTLHPHLSALTLGALGVVYGDIGTSPLYALRESLRGVVITPASVLGVLSLVFWALVLLISIKYLIIILRADNQGEGGVLALLALLKDRYKKFLGLFLVIAMVGAGLLLGDGMLTPAISVLSAVEGLKLISPLLTHWVIPITMTILLLIFWQQRHGTEKIGRYFGPIILLWFIVLGVLGLTAIIQNPLVLHAVNPYWAIHFFLAHGELAFAVLAGVFLVVTGGEALYADLGHFGRLPMQVGWFCCVLPGLLLNYFGQGALLLTHPEAIENSFYRLAPHWFLYPLLILATVATIIASQAVISAVFSLARQAVLLDLIPKIRLIQTSSEKQGQVYAPKMNLILALGTLTLVVWFQNSSALASIYGLAVNLVMLVVTLLVTLVARQVWQWSLSMVILIFGFFLVADSVFLGANLLKISHGDWIPLVIALACTIIMLAWYHGTQLLREFFYQKRQPLTELLRSFQLSTHIYPIPGLTAIFITPLVDASGGSFLHYLKLSHTLPERILLLSIAVETIPYVTDSNQFEFTELADGFYRLVLHYGFMQNIDISEAIDQINKRCELPIRFNSHDTTFFTETKNILVTKKPQKKLWYWQKKLFAYLQHNALTPIEFYQLPINRTISIGVYYEI